VVGQPILAKVPHRNTGYALKICTDALYNADTTRHHVLLHGPKAAWFFNLEQLPRQAGAACAPRAMPCDTVMATNVSS